VSVTHATFSSDANPMLDQESLVARNALFHPLPEVDQSGMIPDLAR